MIYCLPCLRLESALPLASFAPFASESADDALPLVRLQWLQQAPELSGIRSRTVHTGIVVAETADGWVYLRSDREDCGLYVSRDYRTLTACLPGGACYAELITPLLRTALECAAVGQGAFSLHSACVTLEGEALCFTAASGTGKSTRARSWIEELGAQLLSGDRPTIRLRSGGADACGVPWDGKEQHFCSTQAPLAAICHIRRGDFTRVRRLSPRQARNVLMQQCFVPMWDTDTAFTVLRLIGRLCRTVPVYRVICGPGREDARRVKEILSHPRDGIQEMENEMKIKNGFVLRSAAGEYVVMPTGENIAKFDGAIVLNEVAAFVWEKLTAGASREELLEYVLSAFEVDRARAAADLDALIEKLRGYDVIEDETF